MENSKVPDHGNGTTSGDQSKHDNHCEFCRNMQVEIERKADEFMLVKTIYTLQEIMMGSECYKMTNVDPLSFPEWPSILEALDIQTTLDKIGPKDILGKKLESIEKWDIFFRTYARYTGFSVRNEDVRRVDNIITMRKWVCSKEGYRREKFINMQDRQRTTKPITRNGCKVALRAVHTKDETSYIAKEFVSQHNHETASISEMNFLRSNRVVPDGVVAQVMSMNKVGIKTSNIVSHMALQSGGFENIPFQLKDVYNKVGEQRRLENSETDSEWALGYFDAAIRLDPFFSVEYQVDEDNRLANIFWADEKCRRDYSAFGDVIAFYTTYRTNKYNEPLIIIIGVNNHFNSCVFGFGLLLHEKGDTFHWILTKFIKCMDDKQPSVVITDSDQGMQLAIKSVMSNAFHRTCTWHLSNNVTKNLKDPNFTRAFTRLMYKYMSPEEFEIKWRDLIDEFDLHDVEWCAKAYSSKLMWGEAFVRGHFCAGMRTTQRNESMNATLKKFLLASYPLREFIQCIDIGVSKLRYNEAQKMFKNKHTSPQLPSLTDPVRPYYKNASEIYTYELYIKVANEIRKEAGYRISHFDDCGDHLLLSLIRFQHGEISYKVRYYKINNHFKCDCLLFETEGYPCKHIWASMKHFNISRLPPSLILKQWTKEATTSSTPPEQGVSNNQEQLTQMERYDSLTSDTNMLNFYASRMDSNFIFAKQEIARITAYCKDAFEQNLGSPTPVQVPHMGHQNNPNIVRDPVIVKTKGMRNHHGGQVEGLGGLDGKKSRKCRMCSSVEHDYHKCPHKLRPNTRGQSASSSQLASFFGPTTTNNHENTEYFVDDSTQESFQSFPFM
ncbi:hypothetical protein CsatA_010226 [Cannabis sativa]